MSRSRRLLMTGAVLAGLSVLVPVFTITDVLAQSTEVGEAGATPAFMQTLNDVPLMPGLEELLDQTVVFDKPSGRIVESAAASDSVEVQAIRSFYDSTLPQLGWRQTGDSVFVRDDERLSLTTEKNNGISVVHFMIEPR